jgi:hypothetical protein
VNSANNTTTTTTTTIITTIAPFLSEPSASVFPDACC